MGLRGPAPKPTQLKVLEGNPGKRKLNTAEPRAQGTPTCPAWLSATAKKEWKRILPELVALGIVGSVDSAALAAYCTCVATVQEAEKIIQEEGLIVYAPSGYPQQHPAVGIRSAALTQMRHFLSEFGMSPSSRSRIVTPPKEEPEDPMAEFLQ